jgi:hypothetical protein
MYFVYPLAILSEQANILLVVLCIITIILMIGLIMLSLNVEFILESGFSKLLLFWENRGIKMLVLKNLVSHRV